MWLFIAFVGVPLIEIALFIQIGGLLGLWPTLLFVIVTAALGTALVRSQGLQTLANLRTATETGTDPSRDLAHGAMILFSGALLLTPGFFTDAVGFALMVPAVRDALFARIADRIVAQSVHVQRTQSYRAPRAHGVIDGEFEEVDPDSVPPKPSGRPSGWTRD